MDNSTLQIIIGLLSFFLSATIGVLIMLVGKVLDAEKQIVALKVHKNSILSSFTELSKKVTNLDTEIVRFQKQNIKNGRKPKPASIEPMAHSSTPTELHSSRPRRRRKSNSK